MKRMTIMILTILLGVAVICFTFITPKPAFAAESVDIPSGYVVYDGLDYYLINYEDLLDSYMSYIEDINADESKLAKFYFDTLDLGFEDHFIAYVSAITNKYVDFWAVLEKYIDTQDIDETYGWLNTDAATPAFDVLTELNVLGADGNVTKSVFVFPNGYETDNIIDNPSMQIADPNDPTVPENWTNNAWGDHSTTFTYLDEGHTDNRSIKVEIDEYVSGDAKWFFVPIVLEQGDYSFSNYYRSNVDTKVVIAVTTDIGATKYLDLPFAPASEDWAKYEASFTMPKDGVTATIYHLLTKNGYLITDDYHIGPYEYAGFDRGLLTITFDDGWEENTETALPIMQQYGFKSIQF